VDLSSTLDVLCTVSAFFILHFIYLGVRTHPTPPPLPTGLLETHSLLGRSRKKCSRKSVSVLGQKGRNVIWLRRILTTLTYFDRETEQTDGRRDTRPVLYISRYRRGEHNKPFNTRCGPKKRGHRLMTIILSNFNGFAIFFAGRLLSKFAVKRILKIPPHLTYVATLPCKTLMPAKLAINDKLQGSVDAYLRSGWVVKKQIKKCHCSACK